jgi:hypothetical protein
MLVALLALFVALGGSSYAASQVRINSVGSKQLRNNPVTSNKIKNGAVNSNKVRNGSLLSADAALSPTGRGPAVAGVQV